MREATSCLEQGEVPEPRRTAEWMLAEVLQASRVDLLVYAGRTATPEQVEALERLLARRLRREPLQYVLGYTEFYGLRLHVAPGVLIPRPETEQVVEAALERLHGVPAPRVLDVGTGSGCIPLAIKHERPDAEVFACDVSAAALRIARSNATDLGLDVAFFEADVLAEAFAGQAPGRLHLLISNPPYLADDEADTLEPEVRDHEPHGALFAGPDPLRFYRALAGRAPALLVPGGWLAFEAHAEHADAVRTLLLGEGFSAVECQTDLAGLPRIVLARNGQP